MIKAAVIARAVRLLQAEATGAQVILYGSYARGDANDESDLDLLVIKSKVAHRRIETAQLWRTVSQLNMPVDLVVVERETFEEWCRTPGMIRFLPAQRGRPCGAIDFGMDIAEFRAERLLRWQPQATALALKAAANWSVATAPGNPPPEPGAGSGTRYR